MRPLQRGAVLALGIFCWTLVSAASEPPVSDGTVLSAPTGRCSEHVLSTRANRTRVLRGVQPTVSMAEAVGVFTGVGVFASLIAYGFHMVRKHVYHDADSLDTAFDAGGKVSIGLTATTIVSQWTWSATLLQSSTVSSLYGISGPYWYAGGATIQIILFAILSIQLKTRAPGAKTFLQVIHARFGPRTHQVYCLFAFLTNLVVMMSLTIAGTAVLNSLVADLSPEMSAMLLAIVIGGYTLIGGLGATFYVSYFNTALIFIMILMLIVEVYYNPNDNPDNPFGSSDRLFEFVSCMRAPDGNQDHSFLTFLSQGGFIFGIVNIVGNFGTVFCDQAYWQSSVAAKPLQGVWGFILGGLTWFAIPFCLATTMGLTYLAMSSAQDAPLLTDKDVSKGLVAPMVAQALLGRTGEYAILFLILMAVMSTGSAEVIAVASIVIYDVYQVYLKPFRADLAPGECILCGRRPRAGPDTVKYLAHLLRYKNWSIVWATFLSVPLCVLCWTVDLDLAWTYYFTGILISSAVVPIALSVLWVRASARGMRPMLIGNVVSVSVGGLVCVVLSLLDNARMTAAQMDREWEKTRDIDNPLTPWVYTYRHCLQLSDASEAASYHERPPLSGIVHRFRLAKRTALVASAGFTLLFVVIWPGSMIAAHPLDDAGFLAWTTLSRGWGFVAAVFIMVVPLVQEVISIASHWRKERRETPGSEQIGLSVAGTSQTGRRSDEK
ncbi:urea-proton symporter DUR3-like [Pollicipes pollicipes]|uniref:urea-proton symporter DUR3-like n=1 Tax=Pollicipes pollicipes TaxID=41117 RepID=UPI0018855169|nr:urea-proton symporter DUR3-like [Pollicipes pollicipes]